MHHYPSEHDQQEELSKRSHIHRPTFLEIMAWHDLSIGLISYYCRVPIRRMLKVAQHRLVDRNVVEWVLSELSVLTAVTYTLATVEMATCEPGTEADEALAGEVWPTHHPTFQQVRQFHVSFRTVCACAFAAQDASLSIDHRSRVLSKPRSQAEATSPDSLYYSGLHEDWA